jgi:hypothetical protein
VHGFKDEAGLATMEGLEVQLVSLGSYQLTMVLVGQAFSAGADVIVSIEGPWSLEAQGRVLDECPDGTLADLDAIHVNRLLGKTLERVEVVNASELRLHFEAGVTIRWRDDDPRYETGRISLADGSEMVF